jgi:hypothetical protein
LRPRPAAIAAARLESLGRVVFVSLRGSRADENGDLVTVRRVFWEQNRVRWPGDPDRLPCVIIANQLPLERPKANPLELVTVVPAVDAPEFLRVNGTSPRIATNGDPSRPLAVLTELLLTVSANKTDGRIHRSSGDLGSWVITPIELREVLEDVANHTGAKVQWPKDLRLT